MTDKEIISNIREGKDDKAIAALYKELLPGIVKFIIKYGGSKEEALDLFQDAIINFYKKVMEGHYNEERYKIHGYIFTVCKNLWINRLQKTKRMVVLEPDQMDISPQKSVLDDIILSDRDNLVTKIFSYLDQKCIDILTMSVYNMLSMKEIAQKMGMTSDNVAKVNNYRCKQKLIELVKSNESLKSMLQ